MNDVLIIVRFVHYATAMLLFGLSVFDGALLPPDLRGSRLAVRSSHILIPLVALSALGWFMAEAGEIGNGWFDAINPAVLVNIATHTDFGKAWMVHLGIAIALVAATSFWGSFGRWTMIALSAAMLASHAFVGHAAVTDDMMGWLHRGSDMVHLVAAGFWLGSLPPLIACLVRMRSDQHRDGAALALRRFSGLGHVAVALVVSTGIFNAWLILGGLPTDFSSPYQRLLAIKIAVVAAMIGIALLNRYVLTPRLDGGGARFLVVNASAEVVLGAAVVALVSAFATFDPS